MAFKDIMMKIQRVMLCCGNGERKHSLEIGSPTDVRRMDVGEGMPGLTEDERRYIREKASNDAIRLLSLQSHPPTQPSSCSPSQPPSPSFGHTDSPFSNSPNPLNSLASSREPSATLLNAASSGLPATLPTPPHQKHNESSPPAFRMKSMWEKTRRLSSSLNSHPPTAGYQELARDDRNDLSTQSGAEDEGVVMLNTDLDFKDKEMGIDSPISIATSGKSGIEGFEVQDTVGGSPITKNKVVAKALRDMEAADSSDSDMETKERKPLVTA